MVIVVDNASNVVLLAGDDKTFLEIAADVDAAAWSENCQLTAGTFTCYLAFLPSG